MGHCTTPTYMIPRPMSGFPAIQYPALWRGADVLPRSRDQWVIVTMSLCRKNKKMSSASVIYAAFRFVLLSGLPDL
jgi:hypothetical protein